jgi:hypothetical protein
VTQASAQRRQALRAASSSLARRRFRGVPGPSTSRQHPAPPQPNRTPKPQTPTRSHPAAAAAAAVEAFSESGAAPAEPARLLALAAALHAALRAGGDKEAAQQAQVVAHRANALPALLRCMEQVQEAASACGAAPAAAEVGAALAGAARAARALLASPDGRSAFLKARGPELAQALLRSPAGQAGGALAAAVGALAEAASTKAEENKCRWALRCGAWPAPYSLRGRRQVRLRADSTPGMGGGVNWHRTRCGVGVRPPNAAAPGLQLLHFASIGPECGWPRQTSYQDRPIPCSASRPADLWRLASRLTFSRYSARWRPPPLPPLRRPARYAPLPTPTTRTAQAQSALRTRGRWQRTTRRLRRCWRRCGGSARPNRKPRPR